jgi:uncharacterized RDD family membrane protein YckC
MTPVGLPRRAVGYTVDIVPITVATAFVAYTLWPAFREAFDARLAHPDDDAVRQAFLFTRSTVRDAALVVYLLGSAACEASFGTTPGKWLVGARVVGPDGLPVTGRQALLRNVSKAFSLGCCFVGLLWRRIDAEGLVLHDRMAGGTRVVER